MADAETLYRLSVQEAHAGRFLLRNLLGTARHWSDAHERREWWADGPNAAYQHVRDGARAAFHAVPELRGDK